MLEDIYLEETLVGYYTWNVGQNLVYLDAVANFPKRKPPAAFPWRIS